MLNPVVLPLPIALAVLGVLALMVIAAREGADAPALIAQRRAAPGRHRLNHSVANQVRPRSYAAKQPTYDDVTLRSMEYEYEDLNDFRPLDEVGYGTQTRAPLTEVQRAALLTVGDNTRELVAVR